MSTRNARNAIVFRQRDLFRSDVVAADPKGGGCNIIPVAKRRDGGTRYWCIAHQADATAKYGLPAKRCRQPDGLDYCSDEVLELDLDAFRGGIALWGAVPPVYDTTRLPLDRGIHVHARRNVAGVKVVDRTFRSVTLSGNGLPQGALTVSELDAVYYMVSMAMGFDMRHVQCTHCGHSHLDKDWFSIHPHRTHLCAGCGQLFRDSVAGIGNPILHLQKQFGTAPRRPVRSTKTIALRQSDYPAGIQIWGSNPAVLWSAATEEEEGIHVHAYEENESRPVHDDTFCEVVIDGLRLDADMVRILMAQRALPHLADRVVSLNCKSCGKAAFDRGPAAYTPAAQRKCNGCGGAIDARGRKRNVISNPIIAVLNELASRAARAPQKHSIGLLPETP